MRRKPETNKAFLAPPYRVSPEEEGIIQSADKAPNALERCGKSIKGRKGPGDAR